MTSRRGCALLLTTLLLWTTPEPARADEQPASLPAQLDEVLKRPEYRNARWGILAVDAATGKALVEINADQIFAPASVTKLYSCAAALLALGADHRFETPVYRRGKFSGGRLTGDLILVGKGDLTFGGRNTKDGRMAFVDDDHIYASPRKTTTAVTDATDPLAGLKDLARQVKESGVKAIDGDVLVDDRLFERARGSGSGPDVLSPVVVNDNIVDVIVTPAAKAGELAAYRLRPQTDFVQVDVRVETVAKSFTPEVRVQRVGPGRFVVRGKVPAGGKPQVRICEVDDPVGFARALFIQALRDEGVALSASPLKAPTAELPEAESYAKLTRVGVHRSLPLSEALRVTLKVSHNLYASILPLLVAVKNEKRTLAEGMREQGRLVKGLGVDLDTVSLQSGAGGGNGDKVTPRSAVELLRGLRKREDWAKFEDALPVLGEDGTLASAVGKDSPARGKVRGKTGTYGDANLLAGRSHLRAKTLAGVMKTAKGKEVFFAVFVNDVPRGNPVREGKAIGRICEILYEKLP